MKRIFVVMICALCTTSCIAACNVPSWLIGNDQGQAYEAYTEAMEEAGMPPERW